MTTQETINLIKQELEPLAQKLGEGAEWTYEIFVKQAYFNAYKQMFALLGIGVPLLIFSIICVFWLNKKRSEVEIVSETDAWFVVFTFFIVSIILILLSISELIQVRINPDYAAIQLILKTFQQ